ncbi:hypothetical protein AB205_0071100 [Aquarana catesbeiana]|uniref:Uncharacterized protein n=1 Tax=Aquarana catesbeiana TaxID=8400 RepID=A0A2G9QLL9_AQUCT|nr:hypothetical protein AB205_0071100 [Aquarana catesbeiana]
MDFFRRMLAQTCLHTHGRTKLSEFPIAKNAVTYTTYDETIKGQFRTKRGTLWASFANLVLVKVWSLFTGLAVLQCVLLIRSEQATVF